MKKQDIMLGFLTMFVACGLEALYANLGVIYMLHQLFWGNRQ